MEPVVTARVGKGSDFISVDNMIVKSKLHFSGSDFLTRCVH